MLEARDISSNLLHLSFLVWWIQTCNCLLLFYGTTSTWPIWLTQLILIFHMDYADSTNLLVLKTLHRPPYGKWFEKCPGSQWRLQPTGLFYSPHAGWASTFRCFPHEFFKAWCPLSATYQQTFHAIPWVFLLLHIFHLTNPLNHFPNQDSLRVNYLGMKKLNPNQSRGHSSVKFSVREKHKHRSGIPVIGCQSECRINFGRTPWKSKAKSFGFSSIQEQRWRPSLG